MFRPAGALEDWLCKETVKACPDGTLPPVWIDEPAPPSEEKVETPANEEANASAEPAVVGTKQEL